METLGAPAAALACEGRWDELPGIGSDLAGKIDRRAPAIAASISG
jgi:hypothetical protein